MKPVFIGGTGRSGTTVLGRTLSLHKDIFTIPFETRFIVDPYGLRDLVASLTDSWDLYHGHTAVENFKELMGEVYPGRLRYLYKVAFWKIFSRFHISPPRYYMTMDGKWKGEDFFSFGRQPFSAIISREEFLRKLNEFLDKVVIGEFGGFWQGYGVKIAPKMNITRKMEYSEILGYAREFVASIFKSAVKRHGAEVIVDHTPTNINHVLFLRDLFPDMKFIHIYRDPRDVVSSFKRQTWGGNRAEESVPILNSILRKWEEERKKLPDGTYIEIALEDLASNPRDVLERICAHIGLDFDDNMLRMDLSKSHAGRWKKDLSDDEVRLVENELGWFMDEKGYERSQ